MDGNLARGGRPAAPRRTTRSSSQRRAVNSARVTTPRSPRDLPTRPADGGGDARHAGLVLPPPRRHRRSGPAAAHGPGCAGPRRVGRDPGQPGPGEQLGQPARRRSASITLPAAVACGAIGSPTRMVSGGDARAVVDVGQHHVDVAEHGEVAGRPASVCTSCSTARTAWVGGPGRRGCGAARPPGSPARTRARRAAARGSPPRPACPARGRRWAAGTRDGGRSPWP